MDYKIFKMPVSRVIVGVRVEYLIKILKLYILILIFKNQ